MTARSVVASAARMLAIVIVSGTVASACAATNRVTDIRERGAIHCGIWPHVPGFAVERDGTYSGFEIDLCRAVAAAILGDPDSVAFVVLPSVEAFVDNDDVDLAIRRLTWTPARERANDMVFGPVVFYDGQGFMVPATSGIETIAQLAGTPICVINVERHPETLYDVFRDGDPATRLVLVADDGEAEAALSRNRCSAYSADVSWLAAARSTFAGGVAAYTILPELVSKEPLAPLMRAEDDELVRLVRWTIFTLVSAEELGIGSGDLDAIESVSDRLRSFLGIHPGGAVVPAAGEWVRSIVSSVGNYGEMFDRNLGADSAIQLERGLNRLWTDGGLMYAPPLDR